MKRALVIADRRPQPPLRQWLETDHDLVITLGDLDIHLLDPLFSHPKPKVGVYGNHCVRYMDKLAIENLHLREWKWQGLSFIGVEGCPRYKKGPYQYTQDEMSQMLEDAPRADVVISHSPPYGVHDAFEEPDDALHHGWHALSSYIKTHNPRLVLHGHTYPDQNITMIENTAIVYVSGAAIVELPEL